MSDAIATALIAAGGTILGAGLTAVGAYVRGSNEAAEETAQI